VDSLHPNSPSGRANGSGTKQNGIDASADERLTPIRVAAEISLDKHSDSLRDALPETGLQILYDREVSLLREAYGFMKAFTVTDPTQMVLNVQRHIGWVHCHLQGALTQSYRIAVGPTVDEVDSLRVHTLPEERTKLLSDTQALLERYYQAATESVQEHLADARKTGKQQELIQRWRARMLACASAGTAGVESPAAEPLAPANKPPKKSTDAPVKTWVAVQLIDDQGSPVPNVPYKVTLPDGSVMSGSLDDQGTVRFDEIDPGECLVSFPEIHAREWKRV
jgi:hypothetical protein